MSLRQDNVSPESTVAASNLFVHAKSNALQAIPFHPVKEIPRG